MTDIEKEKIVYMLSALAEPIRIHILRLISENGEMCAKDIQANFSITQPTMSHHMTVLIERDLIEGRKEGRNIYYSIKKESINLIRDMLYELTIPPIIITNEAVKKAVKRSSKSSEVKVNGASLKKSSSVPKPKNAIEILDVEEMKIKKKKKGDKKKKDKDKDSKKKKK